MKFLNKTFGGAMINNKYLKREILFAIICVLVFNLYGCAKPLDEIIDVEETRKIVKKTTNLNRDDITKYAESTEALSIENIETEILGNIESEASESLENEALESIEKEALESSKSVLNTEKGAVSLRINKPKVDNSFGITDIPGGWKYGITPIIWKYIAPNTKLISNTRPNSSVNFSNKSCATSGEYGCFIPCFSKGDMPKGTNFTGEMCCFDELKDDPYNYTYGDGLNEVKYKEKSLFELINKTTDITEVTAGLYTIDGEYLNIIYCDELDEIINNYYE